MFIDTPRGFDTIIQVAWGGFGLRYDDLKYLKNHPPGEHCHNHILSRMG
jgi:hypothetical protein